MLQLARQVFKDKKDDCNVWLLFANQVCITPVTIGIFSCHAGYWNELKISVTNFDHTESYLWLDYICKYLCE